MREGHLLAATTVHIDPSQPLGQQLEQLGTCPLLWSLWYEHTVKEHHLEEGKGSRPGELTKRHRCVELTVHQYLESP